MIPDLRTALRLRLAAPWPDSSVSRSTRSRASTENTVDEDFLTTDGRGQGALRGTQSCRRLQAGLGCRCHRRSHPESAACRGSCHRGWRRQPGHQSDRYLARLRCARRPRPDMHPVVHRLDPRWAGKDRDQTPGGGALMQCPRSDGRGDALWFERTEGGDRQSECSLWDRHSPKARLERCS